MAHLNKSVKHVEQSIVGDDVKSRLSRHCVATIVTKDAEKLINASRFSNRLHQIINKHGARCVGEVTHEFNNNSFSLVFALAESHVSVHTWPERMAVQLDVFLCNYLHNNTVKCEEIFEDIIAYFNPEEVERIYIDRL